MRDMVLNGGIIKSKERFQFKWDTLTKDIITQNVSRSNKSTVKEKDILMAVMWWVGVELCSYQLASRLYSHVVWCLWV